MASEATMQESRRNVSEMQRFLHVFDGARHLCYTSTD